MFSLKAYQRKIELYLNYLSRIKLTKQVQKGNSCCVSNKAQFPVEFVSREAADKYLPKELSITFLWSQFFEKNIKQILRTNVYNDVILPPKEMLFFES